MTYIQKRWDDLPGHHIMDYQDLDCMGFLTFSIIQDTYDIHVRFNHFKGIFSIILRTLAYTIHFNEGTIIASIIRWSYLYLQELQDTNTVMKSSKVSDPVQSTTYVHMTKCIIHLRSGISQCMDNFPVQHIIHTLLDMEYQWLQWLDTLSLLQLLQ